MLSRALRTSAIGSYRESADTCIDLGLVDIPEGRLLTRDFVAYSCVSSVSLAVLVNGIPTEGICLEAYVNPKLPSIVHGKTGEGGRFGPVPMLGEARSVRVSSPQEGWDCMRQLDRFSVTSVIAITAYTRTVHFVDKETYVPLADSIICLAPVTKQNGHAVCAKKQTDALGCSEWSLPEGRYQLWLTGSMDALPFPGPDSRSAVLSWDSNGLRSVEVRL